MQHIGKNIKRIVDESKMKQKDIASLIGEKGISIQHLHNLFGKENIDTKYLFQLSEILNVPVTAFFDEDRITTLKNMLAETEKQMEVINYVVKVNSNLILSMGVSYYQYVNTLQPSEKEELQKSEFGKKIENLLKIDWDDALNEYTRLTELIEGKAVL